MRSRASRWFLTFLIALLTPLAGQADTIRLKDGRVIQGKVIQYGNGEFRIRPERADAYLGDVVLPASAVESIEFEGAPASSRPPAGAAEKVVTLDASRDVVPTGVQ
ncbi:MAG: hypothetical protein HYY26_03430, partial [Acidobacteria bacterium]|nr:hypothetical protein [Acidobacteriota bacterium]